MKKVTDKLNLWVFGPGVGELVVAHVPPDGWLAIDGCSAKAENFAPRFFEAMGERPTHILMTHPHLDHARGVQELIESHTKGAAPWPRLGLLMPPRAKTIRGSSQAAYDGKVALGVMNAMKTRWARAPACAWTPSVGSTEPIGAGVIRILSPEAGLLPAKPPPGFDWNTAATALAIEWAGHRVVLGSDLVENPGAGWSSALHRTPAIRVHGILKFAHHGSLEAQHPPFLARLHSEKEAVYVGTPFASEGLPRFKKNDGADVLLRYSSKLHLTGLPQAYERQNRKPRQWPRARLARLHKPIAADDPVAKFPSCYVHLTLDGTGKTKLAFGPGSVIVHADGP